MNMRWKIAQAAELKWWHWYLRDKDMSSYLKWKRTYWNNLLAQLNIKINPDERILDAGCGPAGMFMVLPSNEVVAIDPLLDSYSDELAHFDKSAYPNVRFENCTLESFQTDQPFHTVFCLNAINHVADLQKALEALLATCKLGGKLIISIDAHNFKLLKKIFRLFPGDILHPHQHSLEDYCNMLQTKGADIQQEVLYKKGFIFNYYILVARKQVSINEDE